MIIMIIADLSGRRRQSPIVLGGDGQILGTKDALSIRPVDTHGSHVFINSVRYMRWKAYFFLKHDVSTSSKDTYGFKSTNNPPPVDKLKEFEDDMLKMVQSTKFMQVNNPFLNKLKNDTEHIKLKKKPSYSSPLIKLRTFTNWNRQSTTTC